MAIHNLYKPIGISPLDLIENFKKKNPELINEKMTYAGRLDPIADGVVLILSGEDRFDKDDFLKLDKKYKAQILFGIKSDTFDILGMPSDPIDTSTLDIKSKVKLDELIGTHNIKVPSYSSVIVGKKPLFEWARSNQLDQISIPEREMTIKSAELIESSTVESQDLLNQIETKIKLVQGDFRQDEIIESWRSILSTTNSKFSTITIDLHVTSGTYIRSIAHELGAKLGCGAILFSLTRTAVGNHNIHDSVKTV
ncbi:hypothetical protein HN358_01180 [Candidatus Uhrbacteria bacterium]|jgi:tRNA pseudouridine55 synthase|nr:hypothetical protein [Candidatus Uhrbacteria bacterium]MBT7717355.1 hypothetical protein [Candidatus Uhrbacteria bacterium]